MAKIDDDLTALATVVSSVSADVQKLIAAVASGGVTADQLSKLEAATTALQQLDQTVQSALNPAPAPPPGP